MVGEVLTVGVLTFTANVFINKGYRIMVVSRSRKHEAE